MLKKKSQLDKFSRLTWNDIDGWASGNIISRGRTYQRQGRVFDLVVTTDGGLIAWVEGSERYATKVVMDTDGQLDSICTCPYRFDCKHGVALVLECLAQLEKNRIVPEIKPDDVRLALLPGEGYAAESDEDYKDDGEKNMPDDLQQDFADFLKGKSKVQLVELIYELAQQFPEMAREISARQQLVSGKSEVLIASLRKEIDAVSDEPGWRNHWDNEGYTPDYSGVMRKLEALLKSGYVDEVLMLGQELIASGRSQVEQSDDDGETAMEVASCMPVIVEALELSALDVVEKLIWAVDVVLEDQFELCDDFAEYLYEEHPQSAWDSFAERLISRLNEFESIGEDDGCKLNYNRDRLSGWLIHALREAGREAEIIPLCEAEARKTASYRRLVKYLTDARRYEDAERWIHEGIQVTKDKWPGIASRLRDDLRGIWTLKEDWPVVAAMQVEEFVRQPSSRTFVACKEACEKAKLWVAVRELLLGYLEKGEIPWQQAAWSLPESGLNQPDAASQDQFPLLSELIDIALFEKKPDQILKWYDHIQLNSFRRLTQEDAIAGAVQFYAPERAVAIWKNKAERLINRVKPSAYQEAVRYLRKAAKVMRREQKLIEWGNYLQGLRKTHIRKRRLIEILHGLEGKPIIKTGG